MVFKYDLFPLCYNGNKYRETIKFYKTHDLDLSSYDILAEPFGGIFGFSRACLYLEKLNKDCVIYINDINTDLINMLQLFKDNKHIELFEKFDKHLLNISEHDKINFKDFVLNFLKENPEVFNKVEQRIIWEMGRGRSAHLIGFKKFYNKVNNYKKVAEDYNSKIWSRIQLFNLPCNKFLSSLPKDKKVFVYFDPPYFDSNNNDYHNVNGYDRSTVYVDNSTMYLDILDFFKKSEKSNNRIKSMFVMNKLDIINFIFKKFKHSEYEGSYQNFGKSKKYHITYMS